MISGNMAWRERAPNVQTQELAQFWIKGKKKYRLNRVLQSHSKQLPGQHDCKGCQYEQEMEIPGSEICEIW